MVRFFYTQQKVFLQSSFLFLKQKYWYLQEENCIAKKISSSNHHLEIQYCLDPLIQIMSRPIGEMSGRSWPYIQFFGFEFFLIELMYQPNLLQINSIKSSALKRRIFLQQKNIVWPRETHLLKARSLRLAATKKRVVEYDYFCQKEIIFLLQTDEAKKMFFLTQEKNFLRMM